MQSFIGVSHLVSVLLLQLARAQILPPPEEGHSRVMPFDEVMAKSMCRPMEQLVEVGQEHPGQVQYIYIPACVALWRCSGCCGDENLECQASLLSNTTLQVMRIHQMVSMHHVELTFEEHQKCECSSESIKNKHEKTASSCVNCRFPQKQMDLH
ncbi:vascular endothelial growth factor A-A-like isoform X2 [Gasterosteus aculeatus]|uniref:Platelet-derived growth factor (PDGF) family profile domain-containing protein n=1 Tax=Gasterosteus aculeatus aculeatus TaxID=481459 RepID=A0AAQ4NTA0_GASAC|nr:vascular endothelial growth factor A-A-like isoform X2 [Gasterosteus aculeatus aculeatus]